MLIDVVGSHRALALTGLVTGVAAGTASAGHLLAMRNPGALAIRLRRLDVACLTTTAFTTPQEVGFDLFKATAYSAPHTGGAGVVPSKAHTDVSPSVVTSTQLRVSTTAALANGTETLDTDRLCGDQFWSGAVGAAMAFRSFDFTDYPLGGLIFKASEGIVGRNTILMGAVGVVRWVFGLSFDDVIIT